MLPGAREAESEPVDRAGVDSRLGEVMVVANVESKVGANHLKFLQGKRVLVLGGSGWLGRTAVRLIWRQGVAGLMVTSSDGRQIKISGKNCHTVTFSSSDVLHFRPDIVLNFAALTSDKSVHVGQHAFLAANSMLFEQFLWSASIHSTALAVHASSGAALASNSHDVGENPYGFIKRLEEIQVAALGGERIAVARVWSVSGDLVTQPHLYAFSDLILQALRAGVITIRASHEVWRRYTDAERFIGVAIASAWQGRLQILDSGGPRVELRQLAGIIAGELGAKVIFIDPAGAPDDYASQDTRYEHECEFYGLGHETIRCQIRHVADSLRGIRA